MFTDIDNLPKDSRIWLFTSNRSLEPFKDKVVIKLHEFINEWTAHSNELKASFTISRDRFIVISVDQSFNEASGCSIDSLYRVIKDLEKIYNIELLNNELLTFEENNEILQIPFNDLKSKDPKSFFRTANPYFFNNLVKNLGDWQTNWRIKSSESWINKYLSEL